MLGQMMYHFSTKQQGSGLGLSIVYNIVQQHGGWLSFTSVPGNGTTFETSLPLEGETELCGKSV
ncbi:MAG: ATP-binding protein [Bacillota bacterium]